MVTKKAPVKKAAAKKKALVKKPFENNQKKKITRASVKRPGSGGARIGSGRKMGAATKRTRKIADELAKSNRITPLEFMLNTLNETPEALKAKLKSGEIGSEQFMVLFADLVKRREKAAVDAAPYIHPRLSSIEAKVSINGQDNFALTKAARVAEAVAKK